MKPKLSQRACTFVLFLGLCTSSCTLHQGQRFTQNPHDLYERGIDLQARGDLVGANTLFLRLEQEFPGSSWTLLALLERLSWAPGALERAHRMAP